MAVTLQKCSDLTLDDIETLLGQNSPVRLQIRSISASKGRTIVMCRIIGLFKSGAPVRLTVEDEDAGSWSEGEMLMFKKPSNNGNGKA